MNFALKGLTQGSTLIKLEDLSLDSFAFDLRPKSFNFTSFKNINKLRNLYPEMNFKFIFSDESSSTLLKSFEMLGISYPADEVEFVGAANLKELDSLGLEYSWRFDEDSSFLDIQETQNLKRIILPHELLERLSLRGELFSFLNLFLDEIFRDMKFELLIDWDSSVLESVFSYFHFDCISLEINSKVEISYQNTDDELIKQEFLRLIESINKGDWNNVKDTDIE